MKTVFFGLGYEFDGGEDPGIAINESGVVVQVNKREAFWNLYARTGTIDQATVAWNDMGDDRPSYTDGAEPQCAINNHGVIVEVHKREVGDKLYAMYGKVAGTGIDWGKSEDYDGDGKVPAVALNDSGRVVSVFQKNDDELRYRVGQVDTANKEIDWQSPGDFATGVRPRVAMNNDNWVIAVWSTADEVSAMKYRVGRAGSSSVAWETDEHDLHEWFGARPAIALTNDNFVVVVYKPQSVELNQLTGRFNPSTKRIEWDHDGAALYYDDGRNPAVAAAGSMAVTIHQGESLARLWYATSIVTDRENWMRDRLPQLGSRTLAQLYWPASHDSGMYTEGLSTLAKTQELSVLQQLENGIRYFDLRPQWDPALGEFVIHHNNVNGPTLLMVLSEIQAFVREHQELIVIDFADFRDFGGPDDSTLYDAFLAKVGLLLSPWLYSKSMKPANVRLADQTLSHYLAAGESRILMCINDDYAIRFPHETAWVFRNSAAANAADGDLRVFDQYAKDMLYDAMREDQLAKYEAYDGYCHPIEEQTQSETICDLFLLSWTCTSVVGTGVWLISKDPNRHLGQTIADLDIPNRYGRIPNVLYVDYCEFARVTDVALFANGVPSV